jgi:uncharacterized membrane protein
MSLPEVTISLIAAIVLSFLISITMLLLRVIFKRFFKTDLLGVFARLIFILFSIVLLFGEGNQGLLSWDVKTYEKVSQYSNLKLFFLSFGSIFGILLLLIFLAFMHSLSN